MIDEAQTIVRFGYCLSDLKPKSSKPVVVVCDSCGLERTAPRGRITTYCRQCSSQQPENKTKNTDGLKRVWATQRKNWTHSEETKRKISETKKGTPSWNKGLTGRFKLSPEHKRKLHEGRKAMVVTDEFRENHRRASLGNKNTRGKSWKMSEAGRAAMVIARTKSHKGKPAWNRGKSNTWCKGEKNNHWQGGISQNPYPREFNPTLKLRIRQRDGFTCQLCGKTEAEERLELNRCLCVNHIDFDKLNCSDENLNTLCLRCNVHVNEDRVKWTTYFKERQCEAA